MRFEFADSRCGSCCRRLDDGSFGGSRDGVPGWAGWLPRRVGEPTWVWWDERSVAQKLKLVVTRMGKAGAGFS